MIDRRRTQAEVDDFAMQWSFLAERRRRIPKGDQGQRYEIRANDGDGREFTVGWSNNPEAFKAAVDLHPAWTNRTVIDRQPNGKEESEP